MACGEVETLSLVLDRSRARRGRLAVEVAGALREDAAVNRRFFDVHANCASPRRHP